MIGYIKQGMSCTPAQRKKILDDGYEARKKKPNAKQKYDNLDTTIKAQTLKLKTIGETGSKTLKKSLIRQRKMNVKLRKGWEKQVKKYEKAEARQKKMNKGGGCNLKLKF